MKPELHVRKTLGREHLSANRVESALLVFAGVLREDPQDVETLLTLGDIYLADGDHETAILFYSRAQSVAPADQQVKQRLELAQAEQARSGKQTSEAPAVASAEAITRLLARLTNRVANPSDSVSDGLAGTTATPAVRADLVEAAQALLSTVKNSPNPAKVVAERLDEIVALLPALLELNIRQAQTQGRPDLVDALKKVAQKMPARPGEQANLVSSPAGSEEISETVPAAALVQPVNRPRHVLFLAPESDAAVLRQHLPAQALRAAGFSVTLLSDGEAFNGQGVDVVIAQRPHTQPRMMESLARFSAAGVPIILDLDMDYDRMPLDHPEYERLSLGSPGAARAYASALLLAERISVPNQMLAANLRAAGYQVDVIPTAWIPDHPLWQRAAPRRHTLNLGWVGHPGQADELAQIRRYIARVMREFPQTQLVIAGDSQAYRLFDSLPESRLLYLPSGALEDRPYQFGQIDILLAPLRNTPFNRVDSDTLLMEAGIYGVPWIASPIPAYLAWGAGGLVASTPDEWHPHLRQLILDEELRQTLVKEGQRRASHRTMDVMVSAWRNTIESVCGNSLEAQQPAGLISHFEPARMDP